jgi:hypothetical protein
MAIISERIEGKLIHVDIKSSNIKSATYNTETSLLTIVFNNGSIYEYENVPWELFTKFRMADSQGAFLNANIKNKYSFKKFN